MMKILFTCKLCFLFMLASLSYAQDYSSERGYVDFGNLTGVYGEPTVQINLGPSMLNFFGSAAKNEEPEVAELFKQLKTIRLFVYKLDGNADAALETVDRVSYDIQNDGWETIVVVNEDKEKVRVFSKLTDGVMDGLVVMVVDGNNVEQQESQEAVFINIIGSIDPNQLAKVTESLDIDVELGK